MELRKVISRRIRGRGLAADVNAVVSANVGGGRTAVSSTQRVVQRGGKTRVEEKRRGG
jgi:hypothetical protein